MTKTVLLDRGVAESPDFRWRRSKRDGHLMPSAQYTEPHELCVQLPGRKELHTSSRFTWVSQSNDRVITVNFVQDKEPGSIGDALDQIEAMTKDWGAKLGAIERERIERTRRTAGGNRRGAGSYTVGAAWWEGKEESTLFFTLRGGEGGWWVDVQVAAPIEGYPPEREGATTRPAEKP